MTKTHEFEIQYIEGSGELVEKVNQFLEYLKENGKKEKTLYTYGKDMELFISHFGNGKKVDKITKPLMGGFLKSDLINKTTSGRDKSAITIRKTKRVINQFFDFLSEQGVMTDSPMPKDA